MKAAPETLSTFNTIHVCMISFYVLFEDRTISYRYTKAYRHLTAGIIKYVMFPHVAAAFSDP